MFLPIEDSCYVDFDTFYPFSNLSYLDQDSWHVTLNVLTNESQVSVELD